MPLPIRRIFSILQITILKGFKMNTIYKILVLNNEPLLLDYIDNALSKLNIEYKLIYAISTIEAKKVLENNPNIVLTLIGSRFSTQIKESDIIPYIRDELKHKQMRICILSSQYSSMDTDALVYYDISSYHNMALLSEKTVFSDIRSSLLYYEQQQQLLYKQNKTYQEITTDALTNLYNRVKLNEDCFTEGKKTLILIDIIGFSKINEKYGYATGDSVLKEFAAFLYSMYSDDFNVYHLENDLFALIPLEDIESEIFETVENIKNDILKLKIITNNFNNSIDISLGVSYQSEHNILRKAELALKEARNYGINKIKYYSEDLKILKRIHDTNFWAPIIQKNLDKNSLIVYCQPIYNLKTRKIEKYELLLRIRDKGKLYLPEAFLKAAYNTGKIYDIFKYVFNQACAQVKSTGLSFSVNIGDVELGEKEILSFIKDTIHSHAINPKSLSLEILEYNSIGKNKTIKDNIHKIHKLGIHIVIDDFGVNCSNFGQLQNLPIDTIKIDGSFIKDINTSKESQIIVKTIQTYAREKNIELVAEYVSNKGILDFVVELGIGYGQGNYLSKPLSLPKG